MGTHLIAALLIATNLIVPYEAWEVLTESDRVKLMREGVLKEIHKKSGCTKVQIKASQRRFVISFVFTCKEFKI